MKAVKKILKALLISACFLSLTCSGVPGPNPITGPENPSSKPGNGTGSASEDNAQGETDLYRIGGRIYDSLKGFANTRVNMHGEFPAQALTNENGYYYFDVPNGDYVIVPERIPGHSIYPPSRSVTISGNHRLDQHFYVFGFERID
ncbi:MAG TPA: hypothetical protein VM123_00500 [archaeon]|nr:hypothetical protein [archaeon]